MKLIQLFDAADEVQLMLVWTTRREAWYVVKSHWERDEYAEGDVELPETCTHFFDVAGGSEDRWYFNGDAEVEFTGGRADVELVDATTGERQQRTLRFFMHRAMTEADVLARLALAGASV